MREFNDLDDFLQHAGVKGMKWGVRKDRKTSDTSPKPKKEPSKLRKQLDSMKRERSFKKQMKNLDNVSTKNIHKMAQRNQLENDLKRLSRKKNVGSKKDKQDYLRREKMGDQELQRKVNRLRAKDNLLRTANDASREQREAGERVVRAGLTLGLTYALTGRITGKDIFRVAASDVNAARAQQKQIVRNEAEKVLDKQVIIDRNAK